MYGNTFEEEEQYPEDVRHLYIDSEEEYWMIEEEDLSEY